jgi:hypothetical protein
MFRLGVGGARERRGWGRFAVGRMWGTALGWWGKRGLMGVAGML